MSDQVLFRRERCSALVITCSDFRFKSAERTFADQSFPDDYDLIARPGAIRSLVAPRIPAARDTLQVEIELLWSLHGFTRVLMVNHVSCRAYDDLATEQNEIAVHTEHLTKARAVIEQRMSGVSAEAYLLRLDAGELRAIPISTEP
jgi:hypothetical protein